MEAMNNSNTSVCEEIWREILTENTSLTDKNEQDQNLTNFLEKCFKKSILDEIVIQPFILPWYQQLAWTLIFAVMILVAIVGNLVVIWIIVAHRQMRTVTNLFLLNLAIADLLLASGNATFNFVFMLNSHWPFGNTFCVISNVVANLTVSTSVFTILAMSIDRFVAVILPLRPRMTKALVLSIIALLWFLSSLLCIPSILYSTTVTYKYSDVQKRTLCYLLWPDNENGISYFEHVYNIVFLIVTYVVPMLLMLVTYTCIGFKLWRSKVIGESTDLQNQVVKSKHKVVYMLVVVMLLFAICWLPYHIYFLYTYYNREILHTHFIQHVYLAIYWLAMSNSCHNPIVYYNMNARFRSYFQKVLYLSKHPSDVVASGDAHKSFRLAAGTMPLMTSNMRGSCSMRFPKTETGEADTPM